MVAERTANDRSVEQQTQSDEDRVPPRCFMPPHAGVIARDGRFGNRDWVTAAPLGSATVPLQWLRPVLLAHWPGVPEAGSRSDTLPPFAPACWSLMHERVWSYDEVHP